MKFPFDIHYARLPERFYERARPSPLRAPVLRYFNQTLAAELGITGRGSDDELAELFSGNRLPAGAEPVAQAYAGHQFGNFVPQLGDGRALLLGEVRTASNRLRDVQLKGSGPTPFSRGGDGRAPLGPVIRECLLSEAMQSLGVPTTRTLAVVTADTPVIRERVMPAAVLTRVAASHLRVGTMQYFACRKDYEAVHELARLALQRHYPQHLDAHASTLDQSLTLLRQVAERQAELVARWMHLGFIHGVLNTDNVALSGETIDYGPCAFMEEFQADALFSSVDQMGRYAYNQQASVMRWNLARLAEALLSAEAEPASDARLPEARAILDEFSDNFESHWLSGFRRKLGLSADASDEKDRWLVEDLLRLMQENTLDFTETWSGLADHLEAGGYSTDPRLPDNEAWYQWVVDWQTRLQQQAGGAESAVSAMRKANPVIIPRNHHVEAVINAALQGNYEPFEAMLTAVTRPFSPSDDRRWLAPARPEERVQRTFCGT